MKFRKNFLRKWKQIYISVSRIQGGKSGSLDPMDPGGSYWILMDPVGSSWILMDPNGS